MHERILTDLDLTPEEHLEFRRLHSSVLSPGSPMSINPYYVGYNICATSSGGGTARRTRIMPEERLARRDSCSASYRRGHEEDLRSAPRRSRHVRSCAST